MCKRQGELFGALSRLSLSYDFAFLAILLDSMAEKPTDIYEGKCMIHPLRRCPVAAKCDALSYSANMSIAMSYFKIKDDMADGGLSKKTAAYPIFAAMLKKVRKLYPEKIGILEKCLDNLTELERESCKTPDLPAREFGNLTAELFAYGDRDIRVLRNLGYNLGRWLYITDAADDWAEDIKKKSYNPFETEEDIRENLPSLWYNMSEIAAAYELLNIKRNKPLLDNIIYLGIKNSTDRVMKKYDRMERS